MNQTETLQLMLGALLADTYPEIAQRCTVEVTQHERLFVVGDRADGVVLRFGRQALRASVVPIDRALHEGAMAVQQHLLEERLARRELDTMALWAADQRRNPCTD